MQNRKKIHRGLQFCSIHTSRHFCWIINLYFLSVPIKTFCVFHAQNFTLRLVLQLVYRNVRTRYNEQATIQMLRVVNRNVSNPDILVCHDCWMQEV